MISELSLFPYFAIFIIYFIIIVNDYYMLQTSNND